MKPLVTFTLSCVVSVEYFNQHDLTSVYKGRIDRNEPVRRHDARQYVLPGMSIRDNVLPSTNTEINGGKGRATVYSNCESKKCRTKQNITLQASQHSSCEKSKYGELQQSEPRISTSFFCSHSRSLPLLLLWFKMVCTVRYNKVNK